MFPRTTAAATAATALAAVACPARDGRCDLRAVRSFAFIYELGEPRVVGGRGVLGARRETRRRLGSTADPSVEDRPQTRGVGGGA